MGQEAQASTFDFSARCLEGIGIVRKRLLGAKKSIEEQVKAGEEVDFDERAELVTGYAEAQNAQLRARCNRQTEEYNQAVAEVTKVRDIILKFIRDERTKQSIKEHDQSDDSESDEADV